MAIERNASGHISVSQLAFDLLAEKLNFTYVLITFEKKKQLLIAIYI